MAAPSVTFFILTSHKQAYFSLFQDRPAAQAVPNVHKLPLNLRIDRVNTFAPWQYTQTSVVCTDVNTHTPIPRILTITSFALTFFFFYIWSEQTYNHTPPLYM